MTTPQLPARLTEIIADFQECEGQEKLEYLLEFAERMPPLPAELVMRKDENHQVHECMTPVFVYAQNNAGNLRFYFDVPAESPTVRGFATILHEGAYDLTPSQVLTIPFDFYLGMGLQKVLTGQRLHGLGAILRYMQALAQAA